MSTSAITPIALTPPIAQRVRAYFAAPNRANAQPVVFDPAQNGGFNLSAPPAPWLDLGWVDTFERKSGTKIVALRSGAPGLPLSQVRTEVDSLVTLHFLSWGKLQMAVTGGSEQMNLLATATGASANGSGGAAAAAIPVQTGSTSTFVAIAESQLAGFAAGQMIVVDGNYTGQTGYVGSGASGAYVSSSTEVNNDPNYIRRVSFNVARITSVTATGLQLAQPLIAGAPTTAMFVQPILGFVDREGSNFFSGMVCAVCDSGRAGGANPAALSAIADCSERHGVDETTGGSAEEGGHLRDGFAGGTVSGVTGDRCQRWSTGALLSELPTGFGHEPVVMTLHNEENA